VWEPDDRLHEAGERVGLRRIVVASIIGIDRFTAGYNQARIAHEWAMLSGRSRYACCARHSFTSPSRSSWSGAGRAR
jgi:hypothetical protein